MYSVIVYMKIIKTKAKNCSEKEGIFASGILLEFEQCNINIL